MNELQPLVDPLQAHLNHIAHTAYDALHRHRIDQTQDVQIERHIGVDGSVPLSHHGTETTQNQNKKKEEEVDRIPVGEFHRVAGIPRE